MGWQVCEVAADSSLRRRRMVGVKLVVRPGQIGPKTRCDRPFSPLGVRPDRYDGAVIVHAGVGRRAGPGAADERCRRSRLDRLRGRGACRPGDDLETFLAKTVLRLANYAVTGAVGEGEDVGEAVDEGIDLASRASGWAARGLTAVIDATRGRSALAAGEPVAARGLAALAGVEASHTRQFARSGEPSAAPTPAKEARRWLGPRNVVGV
jgi:hypothetical protein